MANKGSKDDTSFTNQNSKISINPSQRTEKSDYSERIHQFLENNKKKMAELYGDEFSEPEHWGAYLAARLVLAYIDKDQHNDTNKHWYKDLSIDQENRSKKLIVFSCHTGFIAHTGRPLLVAEELRRLGHHVVFMVDQNTKPDEAQKPTQRKYVKFIQQKGFEIFDIHEYAHEKVMMYKARVKGGNWGYYTYGLIKKQVKNYLITLDKITQKYRKPDRL